MITIDADFHIHSRYSKGTSDDMTVPNLAKGGEGKGLDILGTGDATHPGWLKHLEENLKGEGGIYSYKESKTKFLITAEVEDKNRVHHLLLFPDIDSAERFRGEIKSNSADIEKEGRPHVSLSGEELIDLANDCDAMLGPCHAFTPWTSLYKEFDSIKACYGDNVRYVKFLELGLSADSDMADRILELKDLTFMSNSDAHSLWPHRIGREFNRLLVKELSFSEIRKAIERKSGRMFTLNVGLNPKEGKYHETACTRCYMKFKIDDALRLKRRCPECNGIIKIGAKQRIEELAKGNKARGSPEVNLRTGSPEGKSRAEHPKHRPPYIYTIPLAEVIGLARGVSTLQSARIQSEWLKMIERFGPEIKILIDKDIKCLKKYDEEIGGIIEAFRAGKMQYESGGGGKYGKPLWNKPLKEDYFDCSQKCLSQF